MRRGRWRWNKFAIHMLSESLLKDGIRDSICWVTGKKGLSLTTNPKRVTCKFCQKIMENKYVDESKESVNGSKDANQSTR